MHNLPSRFNEDIIKNCSSLIKWFNMCKPIANMGLGPQVSNHDGMIQNKSWSWYLTNQFTLEIIFHNKMKNYKCLTNNSSLASAIFVPFYAGLEIGRHLWDFNTSVRDAASLDLIKWLTSKPEWKYMYGRDHFFIGGRISWDFRRQTDVDSDWGNKLLLLPEAKNMTMLSIESSTIGENELAIPYPSYFHPTSKREILEWQENILSKKRQYLYSFLGAPRPRTLHTIRDEIISLCLNSFETCSFLNCNKASVDCNEPFQVMKMLMNSIFCLQPAGDSYTRRSIFDSILAGCIPVFFHPKSAYEQYLWHFPKDYRKYSVFIREDMVRNGKANIDKILVEISENEVLAMRKEVSDLIPNVIYGDPRIRLDDFDDAFDIAVKRMIERVDDVRKKMKANETNG
ncbi:hypothetical protein ACJIZ3_018068 [Penstemon smallii]|uniref:Exostosin GT47 domain-containing protein n=1 Tax=Penstemon smallii TaxID=265156 RepID=A0ABD3SXA9_9LAMI